MLTVTGVGSLVINTNRLATPPTHRPRRYKLLRSQRGPADHLLPSAGIPGELRRLAHHACRNRRDLQQSGSLQRSFRPGTVSGTNGTTLTITGVGTVVVAANKAGSFDYAAATQATQSIVVNAAPQTISFPAPASPVTYPVSPVTLAATGGASGNPVVFSVVSGPGTVSGTNGTTLTITDSGTVVVAANQAGSANYTAAPQVTRTIVVNPPRVRFSSRPPQAARSPVRARPSSGHPLRVPHSMSSGWAPPGLAQVMCTTRLKRPQPPSPPGWSAAYPPTAHRSMRGCTRRSAEPGSTTTTPTRSRAPRFRRY